MTILTTFELKPTTGSSEALQQFLAEILPATLAFDGCHNAQFGISDIDNQSVLLIEEWHSKEAFEHYIEWRIKTGDFSNLGRLLTQAPTISHFFKQ